MINCRWNIILILFWSLLFGEYLCFCSLCFVGWFLVLCHWFCSSIKTSYSQNLCFVVRVLSFHAFTLCSSDIHNKNLKVEKIIHQKMSLTADFAVTPMSFFQMSRFDTIKSCDLTWCTSECQWTLNHKWCFWVMFWWVGPHTVCISWTNPSIRTYSTWQKHSGKINIDIRYRHNCVLDVGVRLVCEMKGLEQLCDILPFIFQMSLSVRELILRQMWCH